MEMNNEKLARMIDHTFLGAAGAPDAIDRLCAEAREYGFASVCVNPCEVKNAARLLKGSGVKVCTVINFPLGQSSINAVLCEVSAALGNGAEELDFVINVRKLKRAAAGGRECEAAEELVDELRACVVMSKGVTTKLILECCYLTDDEKRFGCRIAEEVGFDFVKTSTGFGTGGATVENVRLLREAVGDRLGVKAAGGIRTREDALAMIDAGATRLGCSASVAIVA